MLRTTPRGTLIFATVFAALSLSSCAKGKKYFAVHGQVFVDNQPAEGARIVFHPANDDSPLAAAPAAVVKADGSFELATWIDADHASRPGAPAGSYRVAIRWFPVDTGKYTTEIPDKLQGKYADPKTSGLTAEVTEQETRLEPFRLTKP
jgi:hypothetical protein